MAHSFTGYSSYRIQAAYNRNLLYPSILAVVIGLMLAGQLTAQTFTTLHCFTANGSFNGIYTNVDGGEPQAGLVLSSNTLYGAACLYGTNDNGTVYAINTDGTSFKDLYSFTGTSGLYNTNSDGASPSARLTLSSNKLYGTTRGGGTNGAGTVFKLNTDGTSFLNLHSFGLVATTGFSFSNSDGTLPQAGLVLLGNKLYGTTPAGGTNGNGTVFGLNADGSGFSILHTFSPIKTNSLGFTTNSDGAESVAGLILSGNFLFGTTFSGGSNGNGTVFAVNINGTSFINLYTFSATHGGTNSDGANPSAELFLSGNVLYGTCTGGGTNGNGTVFAVNNNGTSFKNLYSFSATHGGTNSDGANPHSGLMLSSDTLYGTTVYGGVNGNGTVFALNTNGTSFTTLYNFTTNPNGTNSDGVNPNAGLVISSNTLYGTAKAGGANYAGGGTVFSLYVWPDVQYFATPTNGLIPLTVQFTSPSVDGGGSIITNWNWAFGDGSTSSNQNPQHIYTNAGAFYPSLLGTNNLGIAVSCYGPPITASIAPVYSGLVLNGGFETADFTGWTESGVIGGSLVGNISTCVHSGQYGAVLWPDGSLGYLSQTLSTISGASYLLSFWLDSSDGLTTNIFQVSWNGISLFNQTNLHAIGWTNLQFIVTATNAYSVLQFGFQNDLSLFGLDDISVILHDTNPPALVISAPTSGQRWSNVVFTVTGTATDTVAVGSVNCNFNNTGWSIATTTNAWTNWYTTLNLVPGTNVVQAFTVDTSGNISPTNRVIFQYVVTNQLQMSMTGLGMISPNYSNTWLEVGRNYSITSTPAAGFRFTNWTSSQGWSSNAVALTFMMASNLTLTANFIDTNKPLLSITNLIAGQRWSNAAFTVRGTATDNWQIANVQYQFNGMSWSIAATTNGWTNWYAAVNPVPGTNAIAAYAVDNGGNASSTNSLNFQYVVTNQLQIRSVGKGAFFPTYYSNNWLEIGRNYSITTAPATGFAFTYWTVSTNWLGGTTVTGTNLMFMMQSNLTLQATFNETSRPTLLITAPTNNQHMTNALATIIGTNSDNWGVSGVWYRLNSNAWHSVATTTNNYTNWTQMVTLLSGTNTVNAYAINLGGNYSLTNSVSFVSSNTFALQFTFTNAQPMKTNGLVFSLQLSANLSGHIQVSANLASLTNWVTLTNFVGTNANITFRDPGATDSGQRFYRAVIP